MASERKAEYDLVRVVAMLFVVAVHSVAIFDGNWEGSWLATVVAKTVLLPANALFFMISGRFAMRLSAADDPLGYYWRKVRSILLPVLIVFLLRTIYVGVVTGTSALGIVKQYAKNLLFGYNGTEYWFLFQLIPMYVMTPFLAKTFADTKDVHKAVFLFVTIAYVSVLFGMERLGHTFSWWNFLGGYVSFFIMGSFIESVFETRRRRVLLYVAALLSFVATIWLAQTGGVTKGMWDNSPFFTVQSIGMYIGMLEFARKHELRSKAMGFVAKASFVIYLVHIVAMQLMLPHVPALSGPRSLLSWLMLTGATFVFSLILSVVINEAIIKPAQKLFDKTHGLVAPKSAPASEAR